jgi:hypothetical protein
MGRWEPAVGCSGWPARLARVREALPNTPFQYLRPQEAGLPILKGLSDMILETVFLEW